MEINCPKMLLFLWVYILCFGEMANLENRFVDAEPLQNFNDLKIEEQLKVINKPTNIIIKTTYGDTYGCVDFYKQPAFDYPSLKNPKFHYEVHRNSSLKPSKARKINNKKFGYLWENGIGCPSGTVPIKRVTKDELLRLNSFADIYKPQGSWNFAYNQSNDDIKQHHFAVFRTKGKRNRYNGATMTISVHEPEVKSSQFSSSRMHVRIGENYIQAGWTVHPALYSDNRTRSFVYTKIGKPESGCYNNLCPAGIILIRSDFPLGLVRDPRKDHEDKYGLLKNKASGSWWLEFAGEKIGLWPADRFQQSFANNMEWGGEVYSAYLPSPQMGNGNFPEGKITHDAIIYNITIVDKNFKSDHPKKNVEIYSDNIHGYIAFGNVLPFYPDKPIIFYGGPGNI